MNSAVMEALVARVEAALVELRALVLVVARALPEALVALVTAEKAWAEAAQILVDQAVPVEAPRAAMEAAHAMSSADSSCLRIRSWAGFSRSRSSLVAGEIVLVREALRSVLKSQVVWTDVQRHEAEPNERSASFQHVFG